MTDQLSSDLNATIAAAINAKVEASVIAALSGDEVLGKYVAAALNQQIEVKDGGYNTRRTTFLRDTIDRTMQQAVKDAVHSFIQGEKELIEAEVGKALRKQAAKIANQFVTHLAEQTIGRSYGVNVELRFPNN